MHYSPTVRPAIARVSLGDPLTLLGLPPRDTRRWTAHRKAEIVAAVESGLVTSDDVCAWYDLSREELDEWRRASENGGTLALRITHLRGPRTRTQPRMAAFIHQ
ncbi:MAG: DUF1153 domain-containing protein [Sphingomonadales bacterium]|nr:DUF1153 domain-containing protein [Sphingomonadales bacterium]